MHGKRSNLRFDLVLGGPQQSSFVEHSILGEHATKRFKPLLSSLLPYSMAMDVLRHSREPQQLLPPSLQEFAAIGLRYPRFFEPL